MNEMTISIQDLAAVLVRKGKKIIAFAVLLAVLLGGWKGFRIWWNLNDETYVDLKQMEYEQALLEQERIIEKAEMVIAQQRDYIDNSLWMKMNPDKYTYYIYLAISDVDENALDMSFSIEETPVDYLMRKITSQYLLMWSGFDMPSELGIAKYENIEDKYVRELLGFQAQSSQILRLHAVGNSAADAQELAENAYRLLSGTHDAVEKSSFPHTLERFEDVQKHQYDTELQQAQLEEYRKIDVQQGEIVKARVAIKELEEPDGPVVAVIKMMIIGGIAGGVLACIWYCCKAILQGSLQSSAHGEQTWKIPFIGAVVYRNSWWNRIADRISGERVWKDEKQALGYIAEMVKLRADGQPILVVSSLKLEGRSAVQKLQEALCAEGVQVICADDFAYNPGAVAALNRCATVLLAESVGESKADEVGKILAHAEEIGKPAVGFVLV